jgi:hypothetical protein
MKDRTQVIAVVGVVLLSATSAGLAPALAATAPAAACAATDSVSITLTLSGGGHQIQPVFSGTAGVVSPDGYLDLTRYSGSVLITITLVDSASLNRDIVALSYAEGLTEADPLLPVLSGNHHQIRNIQHSTNQPQLSFCYVNDNTGPDGAAAAKSYLYGRYGIWVVDPAHPSMPILIDPGISNGGPSSVPP